jgi:hypothetical protein
MCIHVRRSTPDLRIFNLLPESSIRSNLPGHIIKFVDDWDVYHAHEGEIHCGSNVKRTPLNNWWEKLPDLPKNH